MHSDSQGYIKSPKKIVGVRISNVKDTSGCANYHFQVKSSNARTCCCAAQYVVLTVKLNVAKVGKLQFTRGQSCLQKWGGAKIDLHVQDEVNFKGIIFFLVKQKHKNIKF